MRRIPSWIPGADMESPSLLTPGQAQKCVQPDPYSPPHFSYLLLIFPPVFLKYFFKKNLIIRELSTYSTRHETDEPFLVASHGAKINQLWINRVRM